MFAEVERIRGAPGDENSFRAFDLNQSLSPTREMLCSPDDLRQCFVDELPERAGPAYLGFDFGEATSATACAAVWPSTGRTECWMAYGDVHHQSPSVHVGTTRHMRRWSTAASCGLYPGRVVHVSEFLSDVQADLAGVRVAGAAADSV